jgi:large subunit ribosomal protein L9
MCGSPSLGRPTAAPNPFHEDSEDSAMPAKTIRSIELLLNQNVEGLGIVGDVVKVKPGFARNYLLPLGIAEFPSEERIEELKEARATAQAELEAIREQRKGIIESLLDKSVELVRSCNDRGVLYGSVTQRDISDALNELGHMVDERSIRLSQPIRRLGEFSVIVQFEKDLRAEVAVKVLPDRSLAEEMDEMEFDNEGELIEKPRKRRGDPQDASSDSEGHENQEKGKTSAEDSTREPVEANAEGT